MKITRRPAFCAYPKWRRWGLKISDPCPVELMTPFGIFCWHGHPLYRMFDTIHITLGVWKSSRFHCGKPHRFLCVSHTPTN